MLPPPARRRRHHGVAAVGWIAFLTALLAVGRLSADSQDKSGVAPNTISLPKGPGSIEGLGDSFQPALNTGTSRYGLAVRVPPGPGGFAPSVSLGYEAGGGNGILGLGWVLKVPSVRRQPDKGIPRYEEAPPQHPDRFVSESREELVPVGGGMFFCKNESGFVRYRQVGTHWEGTRPDGTLMVFGEGAGARVADTDHPGRVFEWLLEREVDTHGNVIVYRYEGATGYRNLNQKYLAEIRYGPGSPPFPAFHFVHFEYAPRTDWFEDGRPGFLVRTGMRLEAVSVGSQGIALGFPHAPGDANLDGAPDSLVRRYKFEYLPPDATASGISLLARVGVVGASGTAELPPMTLGYQVQNPPMTSDAAGLAIGIDGPGPELLMDRGFTEFVDLDGDGLPDLLATSGGVGGESHEAWMNRGVRSGFLTFERKVMGGDDRAFLLNLQTNAVHLADMDGDGLSDLVSVKAGQGVVQYFRNEGQLRWGAPVLLRSPDGDDPPMPFAETRARVADLDFDKRSDLVRFEGRFRGGEIWLNDGTQSYARTGFPGAASDVLDDSESFEIEDINGDRVPDLVMLKPGGLAYAAGVGYGRFLDDVLVEIEDWPLDSELVRRVRIADITGDGLPDLVLDSPFGDGELWYWINRGNRSFSPRHRIVGLPERQSSSRATRWADINGNGTVDLVYADTFSFDPFQAVDIGELIGCGPGNHLLNRIENGIGRVIRIAYKASTVDRLADASTSPWPDAVPFPVTVVDRVETSDSLGHAYATSFVYHDGYYDAAERQFRGFARVEQVDLGDANAPTLVTRSHFDTGKEHEAMKGKVLRLTVESEDGRQFSDSRTGWLIPPLTLHQGLDERSVAYAHPTNTVRIVRELGQGAERRLESEVEFDRYGNQVANRDYGIVEDGDRAAFGDERFTRTAYAVNAEAWILRKPAWTEVTDARTNRVSRAEFYYDDPSFSGSNPGEVSRGDLTLRREWVGPGTNGAPGGDRYVRVARTRYDAHGNAVLLLDPLAAPAAGDPDLARGHAREIEYDGFHALPVREVIHVGDGKDPLVFHAAYDPGFGTLTRSVDFDGNPTRYGYDEFGRLTSVARPDDAESFPSTEYTYALAVPHRGTNLVNYLETRRLDKTNRVEGARRDSYLVTRDFVDGLGRKLMSKQEATEDGGPTRVSVKDAARFNARQKPSEVLNPFYTALAGSLEDQLAFEDIEAPGWTGRFALGDSLVSLGLATAHRSRSSYDATLRETVSTNPDGTFRRTVYEPLATRSFDEDDNDPRSEFRETPVVRQQDGLGRLVRVDEITRLTDEGGATNVLRTWTTRYQYDPNDQITRITDSQGNQKGFRYDGMKRRTDVDDPDRGPMHYLFDDASNVVETLDAKGQRIVYTYDGANRLRTEDYRDEGKPVSRNLAYDPSVPVSATNRADVVYFYDVPAAGLDSGDGTTAIGTNVKGRLAYVWDLSGEEHTSHDARGRVAWVVKRVRDPLHGQLVGYRTGFDYDPMDRITAITYPDNDAVGYRYHDRGLLRSITGGPTGCIVSNLVYQPSGQTRETVYGNGIRTLTAYDERLRLKTLVTAPQSDPAAPLIAFGYDFDGVSNIRSITDQRPAAMVPAGDTRRNTQFFRYDDLYRLTRVQYSHAVPGAAPANDGEIDYRYDRIGNMLEQASTLRHAEKGLPVADLGEMDSGAGAGRWGRASRAANDPPGPHALTSIRHAGAPARNYPYDANGNMSELDGMVATWDFKDRLVALEDAAMRVEYVYDYSGRRITKNVVRKKPLFPVAGVEAGRGVQRSFTTAYVGKHFEVREDDAPTKFVFNGETRVARVTGTLSPNDRVQRLRVHPGWNLLSIAVTAVHGGAQLASGGTVEGMHRWNPVARGFVAVDPVDTLPAGTVLWLKASRSGTLRVGGSYPGPLPGPRAVPEGGFLPSRGLEVFPLSGLPAGVAAWRFDPESQRWQAGMGPTGPVPSDLPPELPSHEALYAKAAAAAVDLELPDPALSLRFYHQDHLGSTSVVTDAAGTLVEECANYPFGYPRVGLRARGGREYYGFTQKEQDSESGLDYLEARYGMVLAGRFISVDTLALVTPKHWISDPRRLNVYAYCRNSPIHLTDVDGNDFQNAEMVPPAPCPTPTPGPDSGGGHGGSLAAELFARVHPDYVQGRIGFEVECKIEDEDLGIGAGASLYAGYEGKYEGGKSEHSVFIKQSAEAKTPWGKWEEEFVGKYNITKNEFEGELSQQLVVGHHGGPNVIGGAGTKDEFIGGGLGTTVGVHGKLGGAELKGQCMETVDGNAHCVYEGYGKALLPVLQIGPPGVCSTYIRVEGRLEVTILRGHGDGQ